MRCAALLLLASCQLSVTGTRSAPTIAATAELPSICGGTGVSFAISGNSPGVSFDGVRATPPLVELEDGMTRLEAAATWDAAAQLVRVTVPPGVLTAGEWHVRVVRTSDGGTAEIPGAITVIPPPVITSVGGGGICAGTSAPVVVVRGTDLGGATIAIDGFVGEVAAAINDAGTEARLTLPSIVTSGGPYAVSASRGADCGDVRENAVNIAPGPSVSSFVAGPQLLALDGTASGSVAANRPVHVRVQGAGFVSGVQVLAGAVEATVTSQTPTMLEATFPALPEGTHVVSAALGACSAPLSSTLTAEALTMTVDRLGTNALPSGTANVFVEVFGSFGAANEGIIGYLDRDRDPFVVDVVPWVYDQRLDSNKRSFRAQLTQAVAAGGPYDLHLLSNDGAGQVVRGLSSLRVEDGVQPRIVWKDRDAVGSELTVYGCGFDGATFTWNGSTLPAPTLSAASTWTQKRFKCSPDGGALSEARFSGLALPSGVGRLRVTRGAIFHDDLYPLVVHRDAPEPGAFSTLPPALAVARRQASPLVAPDAYGRKYLYVLGGTTDRESNPEADVGTGPRMYEFAGIDADHGVSAFELGLGMPTSGHTIETSGGGTAVSVSGASWLADGPRVIAIGGSLSNDTDAVSDDVWVTRVAHEHDGAPAQITATFEAGGGTLAAGVHHYRLATRWPRAMLNNAGIVETAATVAITVRTTIAGRVLLSAKAPCGPTNGAYLGKPQIRVFRSDDPRALPDESFTYGFVAETADMDDDACTDGATYTVTDSGSAPVLADAPVPRGMLYHFRQHLTNQLPAGRRLMSSAFIPGGDIYLAGGADGSGNVQNTMYRVSLDDDGVPDAAIATVTVTGTLDAFGAGNDAWLVPSSIIEAPFGVRTAVASTARITTAGVATQVTGSGLPNAGYEFGYAFARAGNRAFFFGGLVLPNTDFNGRAPRADGFFWDVTSGAPAITAHGAALSRFRAYAATFHLPPFVYVMGGLGCSADTTATCDSAGERVLLDSVERARLD